MNAHIFPSRTRRGLGLFDSILAFAVFSFALLWASQITGNWITARAMANEARSVAELARAGRLLVEGDPAHAGRRHAPRAAPHPVDLAELEGAGLRAPALGERTPGRRTLSLYLYRPSEGALLIIARARGETKLTRIPGAEDGVSGVGVLLSGETGLRGPGVSYDMAPINRRMPGFATANDIFALDYVALDRNCPPYLYRVAVDCDGDGSNDAEVNTMSVDLDMGGNDLTGAGSIGARSAQIRQLVGQTQITGPLTVSETLDVEGNTTIAGDLALTGTLTAPNITIGESLTVKKALSVNGPLTGGALTFDGEATVAGTARIGTLRITNMRTQELRADRIDLGTGTFRELFTEQATVTNCTGCN
ncbi:hypothetical protein [Ruegeria sp.]|uniref:hypothetical protein n=1 Tax=Ruegeria sp. TaxID=1879320 RepID=UPI003B009EBA